MEENNQKQKLYKEWHDDKANWKWRIFYYNKKDKRIFPPKRIEDLGWTINFANPFSVLALIVIIAFVVILALLLIPDK